MLANPKILKIIDTQIKNGTAANQKNICAKVMPPDRHGLSATYPHTTIIGKSKKRSTHVSGLRIPGVQQSVGTQSGTAKSAGSCASDAFRSRARCPS